MTNNASEYLIVKQRHNIYHLSQPEGLPAPSAPEGHLKHHTIQLIEASIVQVYDRKGNPHPTQIHIRIC